MLAEIAIVSGIVLAFVIFAGVLAWTDYAASDRQPARKAVAASRHVRATFPATPAGAARP
jgi:hypothetical protein